MRFRARHLFYFLLIVLALFSSFIAIRHQNKHKTINSAQFPDAFMDQVTIVRINPEGQPTTLVKTPKLVHYPVQDTSFLTRPHFEFYSKTAPLWSIDAMSGKSLHGALEILLWGNVRVHQAAGKDNRETTLLTTKLTLYPERNLASTDQAVTINQPGSIIHAVGMKMNTKESWVQLDSAARGAYDPTQ